MTRRLFLLVSALMLITLSAHAQVLSLSTNAVDYMYLGTPNVEGQMALSQHWSVTAGARYNNWTFRQDSDEQFQNRQRTASLGARWWPWNVYSGWWAAGKAQWQEYNEGGVASPLTSEGDRYGASLGAGYTLMLSPHFNIDFGLAFWGGYTTYVTYACPTCGRIVEQGAKAFIIPNEALISLLYVF